jgi:hypothetical protein
MIATIRRRSTRRVALVLVVLWLAGREAEAGLTLTSAGTQAGFGLSVFATGFPSNGISGPLGIAFTNSGGVIVTDSPGNVRIFATDADGQNASSAPIAQNYGANNAVGLARLGNNYYMTQQGNSDLVQINANGTFNQTIVGGLPNATGLVADPLSGHLFVSTPAGDNSIYAVDPIARTMKLLESGTYVDGLTLSTDGKIVYGASNNGDILGFSTTTGASVFDSGFIANGIDGAALGTGSLLGNLYVNTNFGTVYEVNLSTLAQTLIASGGSRGDFVTVDPNGTLLLTQTDSIDRLTAPNGGGFGAVPEPSSILLVGMGCVGTMIYSRRRAKIGKSH